MGLSEDLKNVESSIRTGEAKSLKLVGLKNEFMYCGERVTYEIKIGKFGPYILTSLRDENGKDLMKSIPPTFFPGTFSDEDAKEIVFPSESEDELLYGEYLVKKGSYGLYYERVEDKKRVTCPSKVKDNPKSATKEYIDFLFSLPKTIGQDENGEEAILRFGPYGFFATYKGNNIRVKDPLTVTISDIISPSTPFAIKGEKDGKDISLVKGHYGYYIKWGEENIALPSEEKKNVESLTLERIMEIAENHKTKSDIKKESEKEFSKVDDIVPFLINGKYGYYIKWGENNISLSKEDKERPLSLTDERVKVLIEEYKQKPKKSIKSYRKFTKK